jgi:hypothetical protein
MAVDKQLASLTKLMGKLAISMRKSDKAIKSLAVFQKRNAVQKSKRRGKSATDKKIKAMNAARARSDKKFEKVIALLEKGSNGHRKGR